MPKKFIQVKLLEVKVDKNGRADVDAGDNRVIISLHYPTPEKTIVESIREVKLEDGVAVSFATQTLSKMLVLKEEVIGDFQLSVMVTSEIKASKFEKAFGKALGEIIGAAIKKIPVAGEYLTGITAPISGFLEADDDIGIIGKGYSAALSPASSGDQTIALKVPKDVSLKTVQPGSGHNPTFNTEPLSRGDDNGQVKLNIEIKDMP